jgi:Arc/MetJ-type ribon-helix-helix transcriptional regulator
MKTMNISVTEEQQKFIDTLVAKFGFANRSELFRTIIRRVKTNPEVVEEPKIVKLSPTADKGYAKMIDDIESGKVPAYKAESTEELLDHLHGRKNPVQSTVPKKLRKTNKK